MNQKDLDENLELFVVPLHWIKAQKYQVGDRVIWKDSLEQEYATYQNEEANNTKPPSTWTKVCDGFPAFG
jgi:hypothetical protein